jgi:hypothetical protein
VSSGFTDKPWSAKAVIEEEVTYTLTPEDFVTLYLFVYDKVRPGRRASEFGQLPKLCVGSLVTSLFFGWVSYLVAGAVLTLLECPNPWVPAKYVGGFVGLLTFLASSVVVAREVFFAGRERAAYRKLMIRSVREGQKGGTFRFPRRDRVVVTGEGFTEFNAYEDDSGGVTVTERRETDVSWHAVESIDITDDHLLVTVREKGWLIVPRRAFPDEQAFLRFAGTVHRFYGAAMEQTRFGDKDNPTPSRDVRITSLPPR